MINTEMYEINKPSELTQIIFFENYSKKIYATVNTMDIDLINAIFYLTKKKILKKEIKLEDNTTKVNLLLSELADFLEKYKSGRYDKILGSLIHLKKMDVMINSLEKNKNIKKYHLTSFIHFIRWTRHKNLLNKNVVLGLDSEILKRYMHTKSFFSKMFLKIQFSMTTKYSKLLYEILKDYSGIELLHLNINDLSLLLNTPTNKQYQKWSVFRPNILEKAINEINEKSDIQVSYEPIKEKTKENPRLHVEKILFQIEPQPESRLKKLGLLDQEPELSIEEKIFLNKKKHIARQKLDKILNSEYGQKIKDEDKWIEADIKKFEEKYEAMINLDTWQSDMAKKSVEFRREYYIQLGHFLDKSMVGYDNEGYRITDMFDPSTIYTYDPKETYDTILRFVTETNILEVLEDL